MAPIAQPVDCKYDHLQFFVDDLKPMAHYKAQEAQLNAFAKLMPSENDRRLDVGALRKQWVGMGLPAADPAAFHPHQQDLVEQLLHGFGWRIIGEHRGSETRSVLLSTVDPTGVKFVLTCQQDKGSEASDAYPAKRIRKDADANTESLDHFSATHLDRFAAYHRGAQGVAVLAFELAHGDLDKVLARYEEQHPKLIVAPPRKYQCGTRVLDVFAYYTGDKCTSDADPGTLIRFVERIGGCGSLPLPGLSAVEAEFEKGVQPAYCDHWVHSARLRPPPARRHTLLPTHTPLDARPVALHTLVPLTADASSRLCHFALTGEQCSLTRGLSGDTA